MAGFCSFFLTSPFFSFFISFSLKTPAIFFLFFYSSLKKKVQPAIFGNPEKKYCFNGQQNTHTLSHYFFFNSVFFYLHSKKTSKHCWLLNFLLSTWLRKESRRRAPMFRHKKHNSISDTIFAVKLLVNIHWIHILSHEFEYEYDQIKTNLPCFFFINSSALSSLNKKKVICLFPWNFSIIFLFLYSSHYFFFLNHVSFKRTHGQIQFLTQHSAQLHCRITICITKKLKKIKLVISNLCPV